METKIHLTEAEMPSHWYNIQADLPKPVDPPLNPGTKEPAGPQDLSPHLPHGPDSPGGGGASHGLGAEVLDGTCLAY